MDVTKQPSPREASNDSTSIPSNSIVPALERIDPFLRFLTKATGKTAVPLHMLHSVLPKTFSDGNEEASPARSDKSAGFPGVRTGCADDSETKQDHNNNLTEILLELTYRGVLYYQPEKQVVGFPLPPSSSNDESNHATANGDSPTASSILPKPPSKMIGKGLHGSSEAVAKRRMKVLMWTLEKESNWICRMSSSVETLDAAKREGKKKRVTNKKMTASHKTLVDTTSDDKKPQAEPTTTEPLDLGRCCARKSDNLNGNDNRLNLAHVNAKPSDSLETAGEQGDRTSAYRTLHSLLSRKYNEDVSVAATNAPYDNKDDESIEENGLKQHWLPCQVAYAGSHPGRESRYSSLSDDTLNKIPSEVLHLFNLDIDGISDSLSGIKRDEDQNCDLESKSVHSYVSKNKRKLFLHQARAIEAVMNGVHTVVCTGTGSGKSLCFLLPVIAKALSSLQRKSVENDVNSGSASILLFPTKALAQDQFTKINALLKSLPWQSNGGITLRAGVIDGDTPHTQRDSIASECQIILTNPDTLHAAILPNWKRQSYRHLLAGVTTVVIDEAHVYEGTFGAHVALVLTRLKRICTVAFSQSATLRDIPVDQSMKASPLFIACSATMMHPEQHFRVLCPIAENESVCVLASAEDGSPCAPKHFFVWNPPILDVNGNSTNSVFLPKSVRSAESADHHTSNDNIERDIAISNKKRRRKASYHRTSKLRDSESALSFSTEHVYSDKFIRRRHAADETAVLLAKAITSRVRCIAFCKTRCLVEWVYESCLSILRSDTATSHLVSRIESYRGGYSADARRGIEDRLFRGELWGVVGTNALELGVDVGGIDLTLHCGYPGSRNSLLQQSGRAGRGRGSKSCAVIVCFSSPSEQYLWKAPKSILSKGVDVMSSLPIHGSLLQGHLLCAGEEFPLTGSQPVSCLLNDVRTVGPQCPPDEEIFSSRDVYYECVEELIEKSLMQIKVVRAAKSNTEIVDVICHETHPVMKNAWKRVNLRSIEPLNYAIVDISHPLQGGRTDKVYDKAAVLDTVPYSRVFYHAFPGAVIMHRGSQYRIDSMESPPPFLGGATFGRSACTDLLAFARPAQVSYSTQALSISEITVVKQIDSMELSAAINDRCLNTSKAFKNNKTPQAVAGRGIVTVKRSVYGYKKLSHVHRKELSRTSIILPSMEFDTSAMWIDADAINLRDVIVDFDSGVHALSHAMVAVAPIFTACASPDIDCDHSRFECTKILLFDTRAGGSGTTSHLYEKLTVLVQSAVELLDDCTSCHLEAKYDGGCPGCLHSVPCDNFQQNLSRSAGIIIGKHLLERLQNSTTNLKYCPASSTGPRKTIAATVKPKSVLIGRPSWLENSCSQFAEVDE
ncbi:hypothetical protein HJC23_003136 [Cyclotella cryptica]|uniref:Uncharacterized protein n=1 Tax=Cyclotella cryptica TaxID=29204 RepID=A0ABD3P450_9STRA